MTLNEYLMYKRHRDLARSYTSRKSDAPIRNRILVYLDSDEEDEEYCSLPPLISYFQTPQPCATFNLLHHNVIMKIREKNIRKIELEVLNRCDDSTDNEIVTMSMRIHIFSTPSGIPLCSDFKGCYNEDGELLDLPTFSATNEFASICNQVEENIDISIAQGKDKVPMEDVEMDENQDIDHSGIKEALQWSLAKDPYLVVLKLNDRSSFLLHAIPSSISNVVKREFTIPHSKYKLKHMCGAWLILGYREALQI
nr:hypothetical protein [Tanacetum cinerariifolium]